VTGSAVRAQPPDPTNSPLPTNADPGGHLAAMRWPDVDQLVGRSLLAVPLGATEQHGPHLTLDADTVVASSLVDGLARRRSDVVVAPALPYGASGEHAGFPGTLSIGTEVTAQVIIELVRSADRFRGVVLVCGHGGNAEALSRACRQSEHDGRPVLAWAPTGRSVAAAAAGRGGLVDSHAGWVETSLLLAIAPDRVQLDAAVAGPSGPLVEVAGALRRHGVRRVSPHGVLGDPAGASAEAGWAIWRALVDDLVATVDRRFGPDAGAAPAETDRPSVQ
jgi:mycofactocin system creatininase family protein